MPNFYANYPVSGAAAGSNPSVGPNGAPAPTSSTEIGIIDNSGNLQGVSASNPLPVTIESGAGTQNTNLIEVAGNAVDTGTGISGTGTQRVAVSSDSSLSVSNFPATQPISAASLPLPTGASTSSNQATIIANQTNGTQVVQVSNFPSSTLPAAPFTGQMASTGIAVPIASSQALVEGVIVQALSTNTSSIYVGPAGVTTSTGFELQPGQATSTAVNNLDAVYVISITSGDGICYIGS